MSIAQLFQAKMRTPFGVVGIHTAEETLTGITFLVGEQEELAPADSFVFEVCSQLAAYFADASFQFDLPLKLDGTVHQRKVWQAMCEIPLGQVQTYGALAKLILSSPRAVGQACGNNPIPIIVPCHRVVSQSGLGGFMHRADDGALNIKKWLLAHERR
ncbi:MAG: methylated-DNA--[protein]-cysteine S-methyltransferase [Gallionellaceae bacterium]|nr:methylated-DNA--[protein]-cysteine S-methyltransferase [Gallionellaceae bacterium]